MTKIIIFKLKYLFSFIIFLFVFISYSYSQNYIIKGIIFDNQSQKPLFYTSVGLLNAEDSTTVVGVTTNEYGRFEISNVKQGNYFFQVSYIGYVMYRIPLAVGGENKVIQIDTVRLVSKETHLQTFTITEKKPVYMIDGEKILYNVSEDPSIQTGTTADALQMAPGVEVDIEGNITLRGVSNVEIWINDQPSHLEAENLKTYLRQLPANSLERIEVITNPSARYSSEGTGGIINIIIKTNIKKNAFISFGVNGSTKPMVSPWISYMWANENFSINVYGYGYYQKHKSDYYGYSITYDDNLDTSSYLGNVSKSEFTNLSGGLYINGSYTFDSMNMISFWAGGYANDNKGDNLEDRDHREYITEMGHYLYTMDTKTKNRYAWGYAGIWYQHNFDNLGHEISAGLNGNLSNGDYHSDFVRNYQTHTYLNRDKKTNTKNDNYEFSANIDYTIPYCKTGDISIGISGGHYQGTDYYQSDTLHFITSEYILDSMRFKDAYHYILSFDGYTTIQQKFGRFTLKGGLRVQYRNLRYEIENSPKDDKNKNYWGLFPSLHLSYSFKSMHNFTLSYTRRIAYPRPGQLSSFIIYQEDSYYSGNSYLLPTYTNSLEGGWTKYFEKFGSVGLSAYFKNNKNEITQLYDVAYSDFLGRIVSTNKPVNSGKSHTYGGEANVMYKLKTFMNIRFYANIYKLHSETIYRQNEEAEITDGFLYSFRLNFWAKVWNFLEINASGNYRSKTIGLFREDEPLYSINLGLRADFWKRKISVFLNVQDIFNWNKYESQTTNPYFERYSSSVYNSRFISTGITFRFGKLELEQQARTGGQME